MQLPGPVRALIGLFAVAADEAKQLPDRAIELPMLAVSSALQASLRAQQKYARLAARGDDVINRRPTTDEAPPWATFDDPISAEDLRAAGLADPDPALRARAASQLLDELLGDAEPADRAAEHNGAGARRAPANEATPARATTPVKRSAPAKKSTGASAPRKAPARKNAAQQADKPSARTPAKKSVSSSKTINQPRHTTPSRFDTVDDD
jgi:hypothetical protein